MALAFVSVPGCDPDPGPQCATTYQHLLVLAERQDDPELAARFDGACRESFDPARLECIRAATTPAEALACKPVRKRPG